jgi:hypothetical protein
MVPTLPDKRLVAYNTNIVSTTNNFVLDRQLGNPTRLLREQPRVPEQARTHDQSMYSNPFNSKILTTPHAQSQIQTASSLTRPPPTHPPPSTRTRTHSTSRSPQCWVRPVQLGQGVEHRGARNTPYGSGPAPRRGIRTRGSRPPWTRARGGRMRASVLVARANLFVTPLSSFHMATQ